MAANYSQVERFFRRIMTKRKSRKLDGHVIQIVPEVLGRQNKPDSSACKRIYFYLKLPINASFL